MHSTKNIIAEHLAANALTTNVPNLQRDVHVARQVEALQHEIEPDRLAMRTRSVRATRRGRASLALASAITALGWLWKCSGERRPACWTVLPTIE